MSSLSELTTKELLKAYSEAASAHGAASFAGDAPTANQNHDLVAAIYRELSKRGVGDLSQLRILLSSEDDAVRVWAATHLLAIASTEAEPVLEEIGTKRGLAAFDARMVLKQWRLGELKFP